MSIVSAKAYLERLKTDKEFSDKVNSFEDKVARREFVVQSGYSFTKEDVEEINLELSDDELDAVAGGGCILDIACVLDAIW
ncbi:MAG: Nif11-like leader peptide family natural product precursor [Clostridiales bacterium]|nr:Nif11-like leader peptide family natural product precursor [Clostridiales bacterium]